MTKLYNEICERFPELRERIFDGDEELPYLLVGYVADWLAALPVAGLTPDVVNRVIAFAHWCEHQPRGAKAADDPLTILTVGLYEKLFEAPTTRRLLPKLISRGDLTANSAYWRAWVGSQDYEDALKQYPRNAS